jgi:hypothetical protein
VFAYSVLLKSIAIAGVAFSGLVLTLAAESAPSPDKSNYTILNPTPDRDFYFFSTLERFVNCQATP